MSVRIDAVPSASGHDWPTVAAFVALVVAFGVVAGPLGVLAGLATALLGYVLGPPYALAAGHVALVVCTPGGIDPPSFVVVEVAFLGVVLAPIHRTTSSSHVALVAVASALTLAGVMWIVVGSQSIWLAAVTLLSVLAIIAYGHHRLELVQLGLIPGSDRDPLLDDTERTTNSGNETTDRNTTNHE